MAGLGSLYTHASAQAIAAAAPWARGGTAGRGQRTRELHALGQLADDRPQGQQAFINHGALLGSQPLCPCAALELHVNV